MLMVASIGGTLLVSASPVIANAGADPCNQGFLGFPSWYRGLVDSKCNIMTPNGKSGHPTLPAFVWTIGLNLLEIALVAVFYIASFFMLWGGFLFITSQGKPDNATKARSTMLDAGIGLIISIAAIMAVTFIVAGLTK